MPGPQKGKGPRRTSDAARARAVELERQSVTHAKICAILRAEGLGDVGRSTLTKILIEARQQATTANAEGQRSARPAPAPAPARAAAQPRPATPPAPGDDPVTIEEQRLEEIRGFIAEVRERGQVTAYKDLVKLEADIAARLMAMRPPAPPDPSRDPANLAARELLLALIRGIHDDPDAPVEAA